MANLTAVARKIGKIAVCRHGNIGIVESVKVSKDVTVFAGRNIVSGGRWLSTEPKFLSPQATRSIKNRYSL